MKTKGVQKTRPSFSRANILLCSILHDQYQHLHWKKLEVDLTQDESPQLQDLGQ